MKVVLLAGGLGTRLREETVFRPKPMVEVGGKPILWHIMKSFGHHGFDEFVVCVGYLGDVIREYFLDYRARNSDFTITLGDSESIEFHHRHVESHWKVTVAETGAETPTGGRVKAIDRYLGDDERFIVAYGDTLADIDVPALVAFHEDHGRAATVTAVRPASRFGLLDIDDDGIVRHFAEKPQVADYASAGYFVLERRVMDLLDADTTLELETFVQLAAAGDLVAFRHDGFFQPMDTYREVRHLNELWSAGDAPWAVWKPTSTT